MQEEVEQRVVTLIVNCTKLTEQELRKALAKLLEQMKSQKHSKQLHGSAEEIFSDHSTRFGRSRDLSVRIPLSALVIGITEKTNTLPIRMHL